MLNEFLKNNSSPTFNGGKFTNFSKAINPNLSIIPPINLDLGYLKFNKMLPRLNAHYSGSTENYLYIYLDPFKPAKTVEDYHYKIPSGLIGSKDLYFGYEPFYIGKGVSSTGHRMNQHIADFLTLEEDFIGNQKVKNLLKMTRMKEIGSQFGKPIKIEDGQDDSLHILPKNWQEYKTNWVCLLYSFPDRISLEVAEKILIQTIGSINGSKRGPLTNISLTK
jgi:hypothetical protein